MWEALSGERESGGSSVRRRSFLATIGMASLLPTGVVAGKEETPKVKELGRDEAKKVVSRMRSTQEAKALIDHFKEKGYSPNYKKANVTQINLDSTDAYETVVLPFKITDEDVLEVRLLWSSIRSAARGYLIRESGEYELNIYRIENNGITTRILTDSDLEMESTRGDLTIQQSYNCPPYCPTAPSAFYCSGSVNWDCVANVGGSAGITCYACYVEPSRLTCIPCIAGIVLQGYNFVDDCCDGTWEPVY
jgi:hypothetical protein